MRSIRANNDHIRQFICAQILTSNLHEFKASFPRNFPITHRPYGGVRPPVPVSQVTNFSAEKVDKNGNLTHCFAIVAGRIGSGGKKSIVSDALEEMLWDGQLVRREAKRSEPKNVTWGGLPAVETIFTVEESPQTRAYRTIIRQLAREKVVCIGLIRHPGDITVEEENRFWDSFKILPATDKKK
jgi:hypothetical protein